MEDKDKQKCYQINHVNSSSPSIDPVDQINKYLHRQKLTFELSLNSSGMPSHQINVMNLTFKINILLRIIKFHRKNDMQVHKLCLVDEHLVDSLDAYSMV